MAPAMQPRPAVGTQTGSHTFQGSAAAKVNVFPMFFPISVEEEHCHTVGKELTLSPLWESSAWQWCGVLGLAEGYEVQGSGIQGLL